MRPAAVLAPALAAAFALAAPGARPAAAEAWTATYDIHLGGLRAAEVSVAVERDGAAYAAEAALKARGVFGALVPAESVATASGAMAGATPRPERFDADARFGRTRYKIGMRWTENPGVVVESDPPLRRRGYDAPPSSLNGALDPVSAAVAALTPRPVAEACGRTIPVYDARRRFDLRLGEGRIEDGRLRCEGRYVRVAGFKTITPENAEHPFTVWWTVRDGVAEVERLTTPTPLGYAVARRR